MTSKRSILESNYLDENGFSQFIKRDDLQPPLAYTSGDGIFRGDGYLCGKYKVFRYSRNLDLNKKSRYWNLTDDDISLIEKHHQSLTFSQEGAHNRVQYIRFYGILENAPKDQGIRQDIRNEIRKRCCASCGTSSNIEVDHKNSLKNDPRVLNLQTQTIDDFQALCKHCNDVKREQEKKTKREKKRYGAKNLGYNIDFTQGGFTLDENDPNWYIGTYWGDCIAFKQSLNMNILVNNNINENSNMNIIAQVEFLTNNLKDNLNINI